MKNLMKMSAAQNLAGFVFRNFDTMNNDIPDFSRDLQELKNEVEQKNEEVQQLSKETVDFVINFLKTQGKNDRNVAHRAEINHNESICHIDLIIESRYMKVIQGVEGDYIYIYDGNNSYLSDLNGKLIIPNNGKIRSIIIDGKKTGKSKKEVLAEYAKKGQQFINDVFTNLTLQF